MPLADPGIFHVVFVFHTCRMQEFPGYGGFHPSFKVWEARKHAAGSHALQATPQRVVYKAMRAKSESENPGSETFQEHGYLLWNAAGFQSEPRREVSQATGNEVFGRATQTFWKFTSHHCVPKHWTVRYLPSWALHLL